MCRPLVRLDGTNRTALLAQIAVLVLIFYLSPSAAAQAIWSAVGPSGGDARVLAAVPGDPRHLYLGTTNSWVYESRDEGATWRRLSKLDSFDDLILDHIVVDFVDSSTVYAAAWRLDHPGGGMWVSHDGGQSWSEIKGLRGQSIRAFAQAPSNPRILYAGTLEGVFRSVDSGASWTLISPPGSHEIHEVESLAVDPMDAEIVYAGTWHLPWKTINGGKSWQNIKQGVIEDSDVFSIIIDPVQPHIVFASACSGIYKSENAGRLFRKVQGIPSSARRTRVLKQDPSNSRVVYAGTTEGLYKTVNAGKSFERTTDPDVIVNDVYVDPAEPNRVLLATDRGGVLSSTDGGLSFVASNEGFSGRKVEALLVDRENPARLFAGVVNDKAYGGVFVSTDGGGRWQQIDEGLDGRDVYALAQSPEGEILAGTSHGIFALDASSSSPTWLPRSTIQNTHLKTVVETHYRTRVNIEKKVTDTARIFDGRVHALDLTGAAWLASTTAGLLTSKDKGATWQGGPVMGAANYFSVAVQGATMAAARSDGVVVSMDAGITWSPIGVPAVLTRIRSVVISVDGTLWLGAREGVYFTHDHGKTWLWVHRLPIADVDDLFYDGHMNRILVSSRASDQVFSIDAKSLSWNWWQTGFHISCVRTAAERLLAASLYDGVLVEPQAEGVETGKR